MFFLSPGRLSGRNGVMLDKKIFRPDIRQNLFWKKSGHQGHVWLLKQFGVTVPWKISMVCTCPSAFNRTSVAFKEHLVAFSPTYFTNASKLKLQPNINFFITKEWHFLHHTRRKTATVYKRGIKQIIAEDYKGRFFKEYIEIICLYKHKR